MKTALACIFILGAATLQSAGISTGNASAVDRSKINIAYSTNVWAITCPAIASMENSLGDSIRGPRFLTNTEKTMAMYW